MKIGLAFYFFLICLLQHSLAQVSDEEHKSHHPEVYSGEQSSESKDNLGNSAESHSSPTEIEKSAEGMGGMMGKGMSGMMGKGMKRHERHDGQRYGRHDGQRYGRHDEGMPWRKLWC